MTSEDDRTRIDPELLRRHAEEVDQRSAAQSPEDIDSLSAEEIRRRFHELRVHQIELEMQNVQLQQAQVALAASQTRYFDLYDMAPVGYCTVSKQGLLQEANLKASNLLGLASGELVGQLFSRFILAEDNDVYYLFRKQLFESSEPQEFELRMVQLDGTTFWAHLSLTLEQDESGAPVSWIMLSDITERKKAEEEKTVLRARLLQAQKMEAIGTLAGGIAHDFNNILGVIIGFAEIASDCIPPESIAIDHLNKVQAAGQRAVTLVKQILAFSRQANIERIPLKPGHAIKEAIKLLRPSLPTTIMIKQEINSSNNLILADPTQFHQILMNLCTNAFHAMEQTGGTLEIILRDCELSGDDFQHKPEVQPGKFVMLSIGDTGSGIAPEIRDKIFDPYFTTKEVGKGTGMGLAIIHGIVISYGGFITCESEIGKGTVFGVFFPATEEEIVCEVKLVDLVASPGVERILLIDDEKMLVEMGRTILERLGYEVTVLTSSIEALAIFKNHPERFDAVITDQTMPGMTGIELSREILKIRPEIPIILCTGYSSLVDEKQAKAEGIKEFVEKPITKDMIAQLLRKVLDESKVAS